jgi:hypothetical protein
MDIVNAPDASLFAEATWHGLHARGAFSTSPWRIIRPDGCHVLSRLAVESIIEFIPSYYLVEHYGRITDYRILAF